MKTQERGTKTNKVAPEDKVYTVSTIALATCGALANMGYGLGLPFLPQLMLEMGGRIFYYAFVIAAYQLTRAVFSTQLGKISDVRGRKPVIMGGLLVFSMSALFYAFITETWWLMIPANAIMGAGAGTVWPVAEASLIDQISPERRGEGMAFYLTSSNAGFLLGPGIGGILHYFGTHTLFVNLSSQQAYIESSKFVYLFASVITLVALVIVHFLVKETVITTKTTNKSPKTGLVDDNKSIDIDENTLWTPEYRQSVKSLYVVSLTNGISVGLTTSIFPYFLAFVFEVGPKDIGLVLTLSGVFGLSVNLIAGRIADRIGRKPLVIFGTGTSRVSSYFLPFAPSIPSITGFMSLRMLGLNVSMPANRALQSDLVPAPVRGKYFGRLQASFNVGMLISPFIGTYLFEKYQSTTFFGALPGYILPLWLISTIGLIGLSLFITRVKEPKRARS